MLLLWKQEIVWFAFVIGVNKSEQIEVISPLIP